MKFILIFTLATIVNCLSENDGIDAMTRTRRVKRIDDQQFQGTAGDDTKIKKRENHEDVKYRKKWQYDYDGDEYYDNYDDDGSYEYEYDRSEDEVSALQKFRRLVQNKTDAILSAKLYNVSYCVTDEPSGSRKGPDGRFTEFDNLLCSVFPKNFPNDQKRIHLYYIVFSANDQRLFDANGRCTFTFISPNKREVIKKRTNLVTTSKNAILDVEGQEKLRLQFILGNKQNTIRERDGSIAIIFDPEIRIKYNCFMYSVLGISCPDGLLSKKTEMIKRQFSKLMSSPKDAEKFIEGHRNLPAFQISTQEISTGVEDDVIFDMFKPHIKETHKDTVQISLCKAAEALFQRSTTETAVYKYIHEDIKIPKEGFNSDRDNARPPMQSLFNQAMEILKDKADRIAEGGDLGKIQNSIMESLHRLFQEHRRLTGNNGKFHEFENHFGVFKKTTKQKLTR